MIIEKTKIPAKNALRHCVKNIYNGNYKYISCIDLHKSDIERFKEWLSKCESVNQDYFFMYFESDKKYNRLFGCSSFRIADLCNSKARLIEIEKRNENEIKGMFSMWIEFCSCFFVSEKINV